MTKLKIVLRNLLYTLAMWIGLIALAILIHVAYNLFLFGWMLVPDFG